MNRTMTRTEYEQHRDSLGSFAELMPPWAVVEEKMSERRWVTLPPFDAERSAQVRAAELREQNLRLLEIARTLLQRTTMTPSEVRAEWPEEAGWLLGEQ